MSALTFHNLHGQEARPHLADLADLRIRVFHDYPYLYEGSLDYEIAYLERYFEAPEALVIVAKDGEQIVGASTAIPLLREDASLTETFTEHGIDPAKVVYFGESILLPAYRGQGAGKEFFRRRLAYAAATPHCSYSAFCAVIRPSDHPRRPAAYQPLDPLWRSFGFAPREGMVGSLKWRDSDEEKESDKPMQFWLHQHGVET